MHLDVPYASLLKGAEYKYLFIRVNNSYVAQLVQCSESWQGDLAVHLILILRNRFGCGTSETS